MRKMAVGLGAVAIAGSAAMLAPPAGQPPAPAEAETESAVRNADAKASLTNLEPMSPAKAKPARVVSARGTDYQVARGETGVSGPGKVVRYIVEVEKGIPGTTPAEFAEAVDDQLMDHRSWGSRDGRAIQRVSKGPADLRVSLTKPTSVDQMCYPRQTGGFVSCFMYGRAIINEQRWRKGAPDFKTLDSYRTYLINHEVGHGLGKGHWFCPPTGGPGRLMMQQTYMTADNCDPQKFAAPKASRFPTDCKISAELRDGRLVLAGKLQRTPFSQDIDLAFVDGDKTSDIGTVSTTVKGRFSVAVPIGDLTPGTESFEMNFAGSRDLQPCQASYRLPNSR